MRKVCAARCRGYCTRCGCASLPTSVSKIASTWRR
jgi:hypothetical protein